MAAAPTCHPVRGLLAGVFALAIGACSDGLRLVVPNAPPTLELDPIAVVILDGQRVYRAKWRGADADGRIANYRFALDPADPAVPDGSWQTTRESEHLIYVPPESGEGTHVFAVVAADDRGDLSPAQAVAFSRHNVAPRVTLRSPPPTGRPPSLGVGVLPPRARLTWSGVDPDGGDGARPVSYRYRLFPSASPEYRWAARHPDSIRALHAPAFFGWQSAPGESLNGIVQLSPDANYLVAVTGFDAFGDFDPVFSLDKNLAYVRGFEAAALTPTLTVSGPGFSFTSTRSWPAVTDSTPPRIEIPATRGLIVRWSSQPGDGTGDVRHRWGWNRGPGDTVWTPWGSATQAALDFGPADLTRPPRFIVQAEAELGGTSAVVIEFLPVGPLGDRPLLVVMDTRLPVDMKSAGADCVDPPTGEWPSSAELDSFLFARGNVRVRCRPELLSLPGLFAGYSFDTIGTRALGTGTIPLQRLARYRHVVWIVDRSAANQTRPLGDPRSPRSLLGHMAGRNGVNTLAGYAALGGNVWLLGGGAADAATRDWNLSSNDQPTRRYLYPEDLGPGRMMYDFAGWRSGFRTSVGVSATRELGRNAADPAFDAWPTALRLRSAATDPLPRDAPYPRNFAAEFLELPNAWTESGSLDSIFAVGPNISPPTPGPWIAMTVRRSDLGSTFVFSGFDVWSFRRADCQAIVDRVLGGLWGLQREPHVSAAR
jgi:hypothetical protein